MVIVKVCLNINNNKFYNFFIPTTVEVVVCWLVYDKNDALLNSVSLFQNRWIGFYELDCGVTLRTLKDPNPWFMCFL